VRPRDSTPVPMGPGSSGSSAAGEGVVSTCAWSMAGSAGALSGDGAGSAALDASEGSCASSVMLQFLLEAKSTPPHRHPDGGRPRSDGKGAANARTALQAGGGLGGAVVRHRELNVGRRAVPPVGEFLGEPVDSEDQARGRPRGVAVRGPTPTSPEPSMPGPSISAATNQTFSKSVDCTAAPSLRLPPPPVTVRPLAMASRSTRLTGSHRETSSGAGSPASIVPPPQGPASQAPGAASSSSTRTRCRRRPRRVPPDRTTRRKPPLHRAGSRMSRRLPERGSRSLCRGRRSRR
jgi:hypothetical protein